MGLQFDTRTIFSTVKMRVFSSVKFNGGMNWAMSNPGAEVLVFTYFISNPALLNSMQLTLVGVSRCLLRQFYCLHPFTTMHGRVCPCVCVCYCVCTKRLSTSQGRWDSESVVVAYSVCVVYTVAHTPRAFSLCCTEWVSHFVFMSLCVVL